MIRMNMIKRVTIVAIALFVVCDCVINASDLAVKPTLLSSSFSFLQNAATDASGLAEGVKRLPRFVSTYPVTSTIVALNLLPDAVMPSACKTVLRIGALGCMTSLVLRREDKLDHMSAVLDKHTESLSRVEGGVGLVKQGLDDQKNILQENTDSLSSIKQEQTKQSAQLHGLVSSLQEQKDIVSGVDIQVKDLRSILTNQGAQIEELHTDVKSTRSDVTYLREKIEINHQESMQRLAQVDHNVRAIYSDSKAASEHLLKAHELLGNIGKTTDGISSNVQDMRKEMSTMLKLLHGFTSTLDCVKEFFMSPLYAVLRSSEQRQKQEWQEMPAQTQSEQSTLIAFIRERQSKNILEEEENRHFTHDECFKNRITKK